MAGGGGGTPGGGSGGGSGGGGSGSKIPNMSVEFKVPPLPDFSAAADLVAALLQDKPDDDVGAIGALFAGFREQADALQAKFSKSTKEYLAGMTALLQSGAQQRDALLASIAGLSAGAGAVVGDAGNNGVGLGGALTGTPTSGGSPQISSLFGGPSSRSVGFTASREMVEDSLLPGFGTLASGSTPESRLKAVSELEGPSRGPASFGATEELRPHVPRDAVVPWAGAASGGPPTHSK